MHRRSSLLFALPLLALPACNPKHTGEPQANVAATNVAATVSALPKGSQDGVFFRAIRDAGLPCQDIRSATPQPAPGKNLQWVVQCEDRIPHVISIAPSGDAVVTGPAKAPKP